MAAWLVILAVAVLAGTRLSQPMSDSFDIDGLPSVSTLTTVDHEFGGQGGGGDIVFAAPKGEKLTSADRRTVAELSVALARVPGVAAAPDPFTSGAQGAQALSPGGRIGYLPLALTHSTASDATKKGITAAVDAARGPGLQLEAASGLTEEPAAGGSQLAGILIALIVLLVTFGTLIAAGLPLLSALIGLGTSLMGIYAATSFVSLNSVAPTLAILLGLAVGIDYSLFIVSRHRRQLLEGMTSRQSIPLAVGTAGSAVFFAAVTVVIALAGLAVVNVGFLTQMGLAGAFAIAVALLVSLTLTPALLSLAGQRVLGTRTRRRMLNGTVKHSTRLASGWMGSVARHPVVYAAASVALLVVCALPLASMRLGLPNDGSQPSHATERRAYDLLATGFGAGVNGPIEVLAHYDGPATQAGTASLVQTLSTVTDVAHVVSAGVRGSDALLTVIPTSGPDDAATETLVTRLREASVARSAQGAPRLEVTGQTAVAIDVSSRLGRALPLYLGLVAGFAFLLMMIVFRSLLIPLKATLTFLLSIGATLGATVAVFQWGWLGPVFGVDPAAPLLSFLPILVVGVLFGLSMDYEMFLVSGMRERHAHGDEPHAAIAHGFGNGAKVVAAAALIMVGVFGNGEITGDATIRPIAFALAIGVLMDAFVVRMVLVPALMTLFGRAAWWLPAWLQRLLPQLDVEGTSLARERGVAQAEPVPALTTSA